MLLVATGLCALKRLFFVLGEEPVIQLKLGERIGKRKASTAVKSVLPLKRNLADRLGKKTEVLENADKAPKRVQVPRSLKERLGLPSEQTSTETDKNWLLSMPSPFSFP
ncbi:zinc finger CCCH domain-containing protein 11A-like [Morphnus guianensis]